MKVPQIARERTNHTEIIPVQEYLSNKSEMRDENPPITLRDYWRLENLDEVYISWVMTGKPCSYTTCFRSHDFLQFFLEIPTFDSIRFSTYTILL